MQLGTEHFDQVSRARRMISRGYINHAVEIETGLSMKTIRSIRKRMVDEGLAESPRGRQIRQGQSIIKRLEDREDVSLIMLAYRSYAGGDRVYQVIDVEALDSAHDTYVLLKSEINRHPVDFITINDAYALAKELRSDDAQFEYCNNCEMEYFISLRQECSTRCPFCSPATTRVISEELYRSA